MSEEFFKGLQLEVQSSSNTNRNRVPDLAISADGTAEYRTYEDHKRAAMEEKYRATDGTPLSFEESPLSFGERASMSLRRTPEDKKAFLENTAGYGSGMVRLVGDTPVVRVVDENGNARDVIADEENLTWKDLADMSVAIPEIGGALAVILGRSRGMSGKALPKGWFSRAGHFLKESAFAAAGGQGAGGLTDVYTRLRDMNDATSQGSLGDKWDAIDPQEIAIERVKLGMIDTLSGSALDMGASSLVRGKNILKNPFAGSRGQAQSDMIASAKFIENNLTDASGNPIKILENLPLGAVTGNRYISRAEGWTETILAKTGWISKKEQKIVDQVRDALGVITARDKFPSDYDIGAKIVSGLKQKVGETGKAVNEATWNVSRVGSKEIRDILGLQAGKDSTLLREKTGESVRAAIIKKRQDAKKNYFNPLYDNVSKLAKSQLDDPAIVNMGKVNQLVKKIESRLPTVDIPLNPQETIKSAQQKTFNKKGQLAKVKDVDVLTKVDAGVKTTQRKTTVRGKKGDIEYTILDNAEEFGTDEFGNVTHIAGKTIAGKKIHPAYYPKDVKAFLQEFSENQTLEQAKQARTIINDAIRDSSAMPGVNSRWLRDISDELTDAIEESVKNLPTPELRNALKKANAVYKNNHAQFRDNRFAKYFKTADENGYVGNESIINEFLAKPDGDAWKAMKDYMTTGMKNDKGVAAPPTKEMTDAWEAFKLSYVDGILSRASIDGAGDQIDFGLLLGELKNIRSKAPSILKDAFGDKKLSGVQSAANNIQKMLTGKDMILDRDLISDYLSATASTARTSHSVKTLVDAQKERNALLENEIIKPFLKGELDGSGALQSVPVDKLVSRFIERGDNMESVRAFMDQLSTLPDGANLREGIQRRVIANLLKQSRQPKVAKEGVQSFFTQEGSMYSQIPTEMVSGQRLNQTLNDRAKFYETILDKEQIKILDAIGKISQGIEKRDEIAGVAGSLYAGGLYRQLLSDGMGKFKAGYELLKINLVSAALASKTIRKWGYRDVDWNEPKHLYRGLLMSPPIIRAVFEDAADDQDAWLKIDAMRKEAGIKPQDEFMQGLMMEETP